MEELDRTLRFDEGRTAYDEVLRALDGYWELDEQVLQLAVSDDADGYLKAQELDTGDLTTQYENVYAQFVNLMNVCVEKGDRAEKNLRHMEFIMLIVILVIVISSFGVLSYWAKKWRVILRNRWWHWQTGFSRSRRETW